MTIDERIEALTMNLELLSRDREADRKAQRERDERVDGAIERIDAAIERIDAAIERLTAIVAPIAQLVLDHERRLGRLESREK